MRILGLPVFAALCLLAGGCGTLYVYPPSDEQTDTTVAPPPTDDPPPPLLSAFHGLEDEIPGFARFFLWKGASGGDGMPIVFSTEIDPKTLQAGDLRVISTSGETRPVPGVTMAPAIDIGELRTALCLGQLGSAEDPPARVEVVGHVLSTDGRTFRGAAVDVIPLEAGPTMVFAEVVTDREEWRVGRTKGKPARGDGCPPETEMVIRVTWAGGIRNVEGDELDEADWKNYRVVVATEDGGETELSPDAVADLGDGDNNHLLCFFRPIEPRVVHFPAGIVIDPNGDLNPATSIEVTMPPVPEE